MIEPVYFLVLVAAIMLFSGAVVFGYHRLVKNCMKLLASRSYVEFARGEDILAHKREATEKKPAGDGYTSVFE
jgi:hypothetical protein